MTLSLLASVCYCLHARLSKLWKALLLLLCDVILTVVSRRRRIQENNGVTPPSWFKRYLKGIPQNDSRRLRVANVLPRKLVLSVTLMVRSL